MTLIKRPAPFDEILTFLSTIQPKQRHFNESNPTFCLIYTSQAADNFSEKDLIDILKNLNEEAVSLELVDGEKPGVIRISGYVYIVLPMRLN